MFRARAALSVLAPAGQQNFGSWLIRQQKSQVSERTWTRRHSSIRIQNWFLQMAREFLAASAAKSYNSAAAEPFLNGSSGAYVEEMYNSWLREPTSVHAVSFSHTRGKYSIFHRYFSYHISSRGTPISATTHTKLHHRSHCHWEITCHLEMHRCRQLEAVARLWQVVVSTTSWLTIIWRCRLSSEVIRWIRHDNVVILSFNFLSSEGKVTRLQMVNDRTDHVKYRRDKFS